MSEIAPQLSRRDTLKLGLKGTGLGLTALALASLSGSKGRSVIKASQLEGMLDFDAPPHGVNPDHTFVYPHASDIAAKTNPRLSRLPRSKAAFAVVHAGFVSGQMSMADQSLKRMNPDLLINKDGIYDLASGQLGSVQAHDARMSRLLSALSEAKRPVLSFIDEPDFYNPHTPAPGLETPRNAIQVATVDSSPQLAEEVTYINDNGVLTKEHQDIEAVYDGLREAGVETIYCAGEYSFNIDSKYSACLGGVALQFMDAGFEVRGIHNAVYPAREASGVHNVNGLAEALYDNALPYGEAIALAKS
jgi:hypothetical protein